MKLQVLTCQTGQNVEIARMQHLVTDDNIDDNKAAHKSQHSAEGVADILA